MTTKKRWIALLLTLDVGLGHFYIGEYKKALLFTLSKFVIIFVIWYLFQDMNLSILGIILFFTIWIYAFIDIWRSFPIQEKKSLKYSRWQYVVVFAFFSWNLFPLWAKFAPVTYFTIPVSSMNKTMIIGDMIMVNKETDVKRNDVVIFKYPRNPEIFYVKRLVAKGGDEVIYIDGALLVHFSEGDGYITNNYNTDDTQKYRGKLWVVNPYMIENKNIHYTPTEGRGTIFELLLQQNDIILKPIYIKNKDLKVYKNRNNESCNALYIKIKEDNYFMMGDNREKSHDSRFWGEVDKKYIFGVVKVVYLNYKDLSRSGTRIE